MEAYVYIDGKKYRRGFTTGSCGAAASKAAVMMLLSQKRIEEVSIDTPKGMRITLKVEEIQMEEEFVTCAIRKDGGDDIDATHNMLIFATAKWRQESGIKLLGGKGIGTITKKGLNLEIGEAAINKVPRAMICQEVTRLIGNRGVEITLFAPEGEEIAKKTFNPRLGIEGGISIIGTTGIVEPMSDEGWKRSLAIELEMKYAAGLRQIVLVPGNQGERFAKDLLEIPPEYVSRMSNFIGYMLMECKRIGYKKIILAGPLGKFVKLAAGIFHTHSRVADGRSEILVAHLALMGAPYKLLEEVSTCATTEAAIEIIDQGGYEGLYEVLATKCKERASMHMHDEEIEVEVIIFSMAGKALGSTKGFSKMLEAFR